MSLALKEITVGKIIRSLFILAIAGSTLALLVASVAYWYFSRNLPKLITVADYRPPIVTQVLANYGGKSTLIAEFYNNERRYVIPYDKLPEKVVQAFISAEDDQFFKHQGVNLASIIRASIANLRAGHVVQGGSTITQQVAKSLLLTPEKSFVRKAKELILASQMERNLGKQQILYLYLNQIYLGHSAYGVQAAAKTFFNKDVAELTIAESAMIAGMPQAPGKYSPHQNPKEAKKRQIYVLRRMYENKFISKDQLESALAERLKVYDNTVEKGRIAPYYVEHLRRYLLDKYGEKKLYEDGMSVIVNADPELMKHAGEALRDGLRTIDKRSGYRGPVRKLKTTEEIEKELFAGRMKLLLTELGYEVLMPDGKVDPNESVKIAGLNSEADLLKLNSVYQGVVTSFDDKKRSVGVMIGVVKVEIPLAEMAWAKRGIKAPTELLAKGDLIQVKIVKREGDLILGGLEQDPEAQAALFSMDAQTGQVLAMEGGFSFEKSEFNRATQAQRQPGSSYKPLIFTAGLENGFTPASVVMDSPIVYNDEETGKWKPTNSDEKFYGDTTFRQALIKSRNIPTIKIVQEIGVKNIIAFSRRIGITGPLPNDLSISLGSISITLSDLTRLYAAYPRLGRKVEPVYFSAVKDRDGAILEEHVVKPLPSIDTIMSRVREATPASVAVASPDPSAIPDPSAPTILADQIRHPLKLAAFPLEKDPDQVMDPRIAYVATHLMKEVVNMGTGHEAKALNRPAAGKTGTTNDYLDAWFMGFTPNVVTGVWVGYDSQKPIGSGETGARAALPIWLEFMKEAVKATPETDFAVPPGVVFASIHPQTGKLAPSNASYAIQEAFVEGTEPNEVDEKRPAQTRSTGDFLKEDIE